LFPNALRPLDDEKALHEAGPNGQPGRLKIDPEARARRQAAMGRALAGAAEDEVIVILGASHDLGPVLRQAGRKARLHRVTVAKVKEMT
jgi:hypothetical protein